MGGISKRGILYSIILGSDEVSKGVVKIKNMKTFEEEEIPLDQLTEFLKQKDEEQKPHNITDS